MQVAAAGAYPHGGGAAALHTPLTPAPQPYQRPPRPHLGNSRTYTLPALTDRLTDVGPLIQGIKKTKNLNSFH